MTSHLPIRHDVSLRMLNTFGIEAKAHAYLRITDDGMLDVLRDDATLSGLPRLVLGGGSNVLLTQDFPGLVLHMCTTGIEIVDEDASSVYVRAKAGENWHGFVQWTLQHGLGGLENLSLIPGSVGAAPIQNIGAYGIEVKDRFHALTCFDPVTGKRSMLDKNACRFGYRDSIFKHELRERAVVLDVTFALPKQWTPCLQYADVAKELATQQIMVPTPAQVSAAVMAIRTRKLPDPAVIGNAGSFFKNPVVTADLREALQEQYPKLVSYAQADGSYKLAAGWLIEQCGWKGKNLGAAGVYEKQALVLVNRGGASGKEIAAIAEAIRDDVYKRFGVLLEPEPVYV